MIARYRCDLCKRSYVAHVDPEGRSETGHWLCEDCAAVIYTDKANAPREKP